MNDRRLRCCIVGRSNWHHGDQGAQGEGRKITSERHGRMRGHKCVIAVGPSNVLETNRFDNIFLVCLIGNNIDMGLWSGWDAMSNDDRQSRHGVEG
jgi:hypothetical protein